MTTCNAELWIGDDNGDNHATMRCQLPSEHDGQHQETWRDGQCLVRWDGDDRAEGLPQEGTTR